MRTTMSRASIAALALFGIGSALGAGHAQFATIASEAGITCRASAKAMARLELLFGTSRRHGAPIGEEEWTAFLDTRSRRAFPMG